ncbi:hypothetical protein NDU88_010879 [Pleurodeles waltl]|uniref:Uncharacterized protein n=1 Tax=Pleurodeles waltl TaxID=8319 RepID=A0AAV7PWU3_PLEWA|nr:hypothetical protein NDU88_010879 [Pleurodeles waltl]
MPLGAKRTRSITRGEQDMLGGATDTGRADISVFWPNTHKLPITKKRIAGPPRSSSVAGILQQGRCRQTTPPRNGPSGTSTATEASATGQERADPRTENNQCSGASAMDNKKEDMHENFSNDNLLYASIHFSRAKPGCKPSPLPEESLYSEVKVH